jgi:hypothetical protein
MARLAQTEILSAFDVSGKRPHGARAWKRLPGFFIQALAASALLLGALGRVVYLMATGS